MFCEKCGTRLREGDRFCSQCGAPVKKGLPLPFVSGKSKKQEERAASRQRYQDPAEEEEQAYQGYEYGKAAAAAVAQGYDPSLRKKGYPDEGLSPEKKGYPDADSNLEKEGYPDADSDLEEDGYLDADSDLEEKGYPDADSDLEEEGYPDEGSTPEEEDYLDEEADQEDLLEAEPGRYLWREDWESDQELEETGAETRSGRGRSFGKGQGAKSGRPPQSGQAYYDENLYREYKGRYRDSFLEKKEDKSHAMLTTVTILLVMAVLVAAFMILFFFMTRSHPQAPEGDPEGIEILSEETRTEDFPEIWDAERMHTQQSAIYFM